MRKKIMNVVLFLAVLAAALGMTLYVGNSAASVLIYNFIFLGITERNFSSCLSG